MNHPHVSRRNLLKLLGLSAGALSLPSVRPAHAAEGGIRRLIVVTTSQGTIPRNFSLQPEKMYDASPWEIDLHPADVQLSPVLQPFYDLRKKCLFVEGVHPQNAERHPDYPERGGGGAHYNGPSSALTGGYYLAEGVDPASTPWMGESIDQRIGRELAGDSGRVPILNLKNSGKLNIQSSVRDDITKDLCRGLGNTPVPFESNLVQAWNTHFGTLDTTTPSEPSAIDRIRNHRKSSLPFLSERFQALQANASAADRYKLESHRALVDSLESRLTTVLPQACVDPGEPSADNNFESVNEAQAEFIAAAFACDLTRAVHLKIGSAAKSGYHGQGEDSVHNALAHMSAPEEGNLDAQQGFTDWCRDNAAMVAKLAEILDAIPEEGGTMLDNTVILWTSAIGTGWHELGWMPYVFVGGGNCGLEQGVFKHYAQNQQLPGEISSFTGGRTLVGPAHNHLLVSLCHAVGLKHIDWVGEPRIQGTLDVTGPLQGILR